MNRQQALTAQARFWMHPSDWQAEITKYNIEFCEVPCPQIGFTTIWAERYDIDLLKILILNPNPAPIFSGLQAWFDNGSEEIEIYARALKYAENSGEVLEYEENYYEYIEHIDSWYLVRTGKYDVIQEIEP